MKYSETQQKVIKKLSEGAVISHFRGMGTRLSPSAYLQDKEGRKIKTISVATLMSLVVNSNILEEYDREMYHSKFKLKYIVLEDEVIKVGDDIVAFGITDECLEIDDHIPNEPNYYGKKIKWTVGKDCRKIIFT